MVAPRRVLSQVEFAARIDGMTLAAIKADAADFWALLRRLPGVYPTELLASLDRLVTGGSVEPALAALVSRQAAAGGAPVSEGRSLLPLPHPIDYEWRFTPDAARALLNRAADLTPAAGELLLFGTPGLAVEALALPIGRRLAFLAEDNSVTNRVSALNRATGSPLAIAFCSGSLPRESADAVLLDPPWYPDFVRPMLAAAAHACRPGGVVLISLPPDGARPSAAADRHNALAFGHRLGLCVIEHAPLDISYETPFFERNALAAAAIVAPQQWRRGDLIVFRKTRTSARPPLTASGRNHDWAEVSVDRMRLFVRSDSQARPGDAHLRSLVQGDILPTVSRRDPRRSLANVWTSGNRIFRTDNPQLVIEAAISCAGEGIGSGVQPWLWGTVRERAAVARVADELRALAALEAKEECGASIAALDRSVTWRSSSTDCWSRSMVTISG